MEFTTADRIRYSRKIEESTRTLQMQRSELDRYLIGLIEQGTWIDGIKSLLSEPRAPGRPWPHYRDEHQVWL